MPKLNQNAKRRRVMASLAKRRQAGGYEWTIRKFNAGDKVWPMPHRCRGFSGRDRSRRGRQNPYKRILQLPAHAGGKP
jgi:hypothetical protein